MSSHFSLREFQQNLSQRMQAGSETQQISTLGVSIAGQNYLVNMSDIGEVLSPQPLTAIPMAKSWVLGMVNVRGNLYCAADIAAYLNQGAVAEGINNRLLLVADRYGFNVALLVDKVLGLRDAREWISESGTYRDERDGVWRKLEIADLLKQSNFLHIGAQ